MPTVVVLHYSLITDKQREQIVIHRLYKLDSLVPNQYY